MEQQYNFLTFPFLVRNILLIRYFYYKYRN